jgi:hypothetical protein
MPETTKSGFSVQEGGDAKLYTVGGSTFDSPAAEMRSPVDGPRTQRLLYGNCVSHSALLCGGCYHNHVAETAERHDKCMYAG